MRAPVICAGVVALSLMYAQSPTRDLKLVGDRFHPLQYDELSAEQKTMVEHLLSGERGGMTGPFNVLLRSPEVGDQLQKLGAQLRFHSSLSAKVREMAILMTARHNTAQYEWYAHKRLALQAGLDPAVIDAIATGKHPAALSSELEPAYNFGNELLKKRQVSDASFHAVVAQMGERGAVDLTTLMGYYQMVSMILNVDRYPMPAGVAPELKPLE